MGKITSTKVECECISKKQIKHWDKERPIAHEIELEVPYDTSNIYHKLSGGTNLVLRTVNPDAAEMFVIGGKYEINISPVNNG